jgi:hypothetical protein
MPVGLINPKNHEVLEFNHHVAVATGHRQVCERSLFVSEPKSTASRLRHHHQVNHLSARMERPCTTGDHVGQPARVTA